MAGDLVFGLISVTLGAWIFITALSFPKLGSGYPGPGFFPQILGVLLAGLGVVLIIQGWRRKPHRFHPQKLKWRRTWQNALVVTAGVIGYLVVTPYLGFFLTMTLLLIAIMLTLGVPARKSIPITILTVFVIYILFGRVLRVPLPVGPLGW